MKRMETELFSLVFNRFKKENLEITFLYICAPKGRNGLCMESNSGTPGAIPHFSGYLARGKGAIF